MFNTTARLVLAAVAVGTLALPACGPRPADPCTTAMPAPTSAEIAKLDQGLEVDESIAVNGSEVECVLTETRDGSFVWVSEYED